MLEQVAILGSTGSIGCSALKVIAANSNQFEVQLLTANKNSQRMLQQCKEFRPQLAVMADQASADELEQLIQQEGLGTRVLGGQEAVEQAVLADELCLDVVIAAIVGAAGLLPTLNAVTLGKKLLLANKEALVMSGDLFMAEVQKHGTLLLPVDSEHNAIFQSLPVYDNSGQVNLAGVQQILLTGSGGPFLDVSLDSLTNKTPEQACAHPNWDMGKKISVDSATMMNKGLELIEACFLFNLSIEQIKIVIHPQSIIHSMVSYIDGSVIAQLGNPDMKTPIAHCLGWPKRIQSEVEPLDFFRIASLDFRPPDFERFPCLALAIDAAKIGKNAPCVLNAANEVAVAAFLKGRIQFTQIAQVIKMSLDATPVETLENTTAVFAMNQKARQTALDMISELD
ncbi:MAG: 1-deoxy-D-xylulose-5-phosphate reductoisomerase [Enterobacterales bacterium]|nr:1-deoxy-D-xylulose-5-phosphate reductoisomerase [Enterobacterales bacterium]